MFALFEVAMLKSSQPRYQNRPAALWAQGVAFSQAGKMVAGALVTGVTGAPNETNSSNPLKHSIVKHILVFKR